MKGTTIQRKISVEAVSFSAHVDFSQNSEFIEEVGAQHVVSLDIKFILEMIAQPSFRFLFMASRQQWADCALLWPQDIKNVMKMWKYTRHEILRLYNSLFVVNGWQRQVLDLIRLLPGHSNRLIGHWRFGRQTSSERRYSVWITGLEGLFVYPTWSTGFEGLRWPHNMHRYTTAENCSRSWLEPCQVASWRHVWECRGRFGQGWHPDDESKSACFWYDLKNKLFQSLQRSWESWTSNILTFTSSRWNGSQVRATIWSLIRRWRL